MSRERAAIVLLATLATSACDGHAAPAAVQASASPAARTTSSASARRRLAIAAAFPGGTTLPSGNPQSPREFDSHRLVEMPFGPVLVSYGEILEAAHVDAGEIAVHYLSPTQTGFRLVKAFPKAVVLGSYGQMTRWEITRIFGGQPMIRAEGGYVGQGLGCTFLKLVSLTPDGPVAAATIPLSYEDKGARGSRGDRIHGSIEQLYGGRFVVRYSGTRSFTERYVRQGSRFVLQSGASKVPKC